MLITRAGMAPADGGLRVRLTPGTSRCGSPPHYFFIKARYFWLSSRNALPSLGVGLFQSVAKHVNATTSKCRAGWRTGFVSG